MVVTCVIILLLLLGLSLLLMFLLLSLSCFLLLLWLLAVVDVPIVAFAAGSSVHVIKRLTAFGNASRIKRAPSCIPVPRRDIFHEQTRRLKAHSCGRGFDRRKMAQVRAIVICSSHVEVNRADIGAITMV